MASFHSIKLIERAQKCAKKAADSKKSLLRRRQSVYKMQEELFICLLQPEFSNLFVNVGKCRLARLNPSFWRENLRGSFISVWFLYVPSAGGDTHVISNPFYTHRQHVSCHEARLLHQWRL